MLLQPKFTFYCITLFLALDNSTYKPLSQRGRFILHLKCLLPLTQHVQIEPCAVFQKGLFSAHVNHDYTRHSGTSDDLFKLMSRHKMYVVCRACWHSVLQCESTQLPPVTPLHWAALAHRHVPSTGLPDLKGKSFSLFSESHLTLT